MLQKKPRYPRIAVTVPPAVAPGPGSPVTPAGSPVIPAAPPVEAHPVMCPAAARHGLGNEGVASRHVGAQLRPTGVLPREGNGCRDSLPRCTLRPIDAACYLLGYQFAGSSHHASPILRYRERAPSRGCRDGGRSSRILVWLMTLTQSLPDWPCR